MMRFNRRELTLLFTLGALNFSHMVDFMILMPLGPQLMRLFGITPGQFSLLVSIYTFSAGAAGLVGALFIDRFDRKSALLTCAAGFALGTLACGLAWTYPILLLARALTGCFGGVLSTLVLAILGDAIPLERRASAMGLVMSSHSIASVVGVPSGLFIAALLGWHAPFFLLGATALSIWAMAFFTVPAQRAHLEAAALPGKAGGPGPFQKILTVFRTPDQVSALLFMMALTIGHFSIIPFISPSMVANVGFTETELSWIYLAGGAVTLGTSPLVGKLADRHGRKRVFRLGLLGSLPPMLIITLLPPSPLPVALAVTTLFFVFMGGRMIPAITLISATVKSETRGSFMSLNSFVMQVSSGLASLGAGLIISEASDGRLLHYPVVGAIGVGFSLLALFLVRRIQVPDFASLQKP